MAIRKGRGWAWRRSAPNDDTASGSARELVPDQADSPEDPSEPLVGASKVPRPVAPEPRRFQTRVEALQAWQQAQQRYSASGDPRELDVAVDAARQAIGLCEGQDAARAGWQGITASVLLGRAVANASAADLGEAISLARAATSSGVGDPSQRAQWLSTLATGLAKRFVSQHEEQDLTAAVEAGRASVAAVPSSDPFYPMAASNLLGVLVTRFDTTHRTEDLAEAIEVGRQSVTHMPEGFPMEGYLQGRLEFALAKREDYLQQTYPRLYGVGDGLPLLELDRVIGSARSMLPLLEPADPRRGSVLSVLSGLLRDRFQDTGSPEDLDESIAAGWECVGLLPRDEELRTVIFDQLRESLGLRFEAAPDPTARHDVIELARALAADLPEGDPLYASSRIQLAMMIAEDARRGGDRSGVGEAVQAAEAAVSSAALTGPRQAEALSIHAGTLRARAELLGSAEDLDKAIEQLKSALVISRTGMNLGFLGSLLAARASLNGSGKDLDSAIQNFESAIDAYGFSERPGEIPPVGLCAHISNMGVTYLRRYERIGALSDLAASIDRLRAAVRLAGESDFERVGTLGHLAYALARRFERHGESADLYESIELLERAVGLLSPSITGLDFLRGNLAAALLTRGGRQDIDRAIELLRARTHAETTTAEGTANTQQNLCLALTRRFQLGLELQDANDAIEAGQAAVHLAPADSRARAGALSSLGLAYRARYQTSLRLPQDRTAAIDAFRRASGVAGASPQQQARAAMRWGMMAMDASECTDAVKAFSTSITLLAQVLPRRLERADQEHQLAEFTGIGSLAAACCLEIGDVTQAIELWEHGRGVLQAQQLETRSDLTELAAAHPGLAERFASLSVQLDRLGENARGWQEPDPAGWPQTRDGSGSHDQRPAVAHKLSDCIAEIRAQEGFAGFLEAPPVQVLRGATAGGPVVLLNVTELRSDAIVMRGDTETVVPLPGLTPSTVEDRVRSFLNAVVTATSHHPAEAAATDAAAVMTQTLEWLYDVIAGPVLDSLDISAVPTGATTWPRIWWCPSGLLSLLPMHAAGYHQATAADAPRTVVDRIVSSYTPTLRSLLYAQRTDSTDPAHPGSETGQLIVSMPHTPHAADLPGADVEAEIVKAHTPGPITELVGPQATYDRVLELLETHPRVHFACHAASNLNNPSASYLLLSDHQTRPLAVLDVARERLNGGLAVLSACSTARPGTRLVDEVIHLTSGFQLAGYRHVVATMWPLADKIATIFAQNLYAVLSQDGPINPGLAALATHEATLAIRGQYPDRPLIWAPFLHLGP